MRGELESLQQSAIVISAISRQEGMSSVLACSFACASDSCHAFAPRPPVAHRCARSMLGPSGVIKICSAADSTSSGHSVAVCNGSGLMEALSVVHPAGALLKESVHGQQVWRPRTDDLSQMRKSATCHLSRRAIDLRV